MIRPVMAIETVLPERCIALRSVKDAQNDSQRVDFLSCAWEGPLVSSSVHV